MCGSDSDNDSDWDDGAFNCVEYDDPSHAVYADDGADVTPAPDNKRRNDSDAAEEEDSFADWFLRKHGECSVRDGPKEALPVS